MDLVLRHHFVAFQHLMLFGFHHQVYQYRYNKMHEKLLNWKINGEINVPVFDKSLRNGLGDRSHWRLDKPDILIIEGWFLGIEPFSGDVNYQNINSTELSPH